MRAAVDGVELVHYTHPNLTERMDPKTQISSNKPGIFLVGFGLALGLNISHCSGAEAEPALAGNQAPPIAPRWAYEPWVWEDNVNTRAPAQEMVAAMPRGDPLRSQLIMILQEQVEGLKKVQAPNGMQRVETSTTSSNLLVTAFAGKDNAYTLVLLNRSTAPMEVTVDWPGATFTRNELADPYHQNTAVPAADVSEADNVVTIPPGGIVTRSSVPLKKFLAGFRRPPMDFPGGCLFAKAAFARELGIQVNVCGAF